MISDTIVCPPAYWQVIIANAKMPTVNTTAAMAYVNIQKTRKYQEGWLFALLDWIGV
jgi:hypothetical protein